MLYRYLLYLGLLVSSGLVNAVVNVQDIRWTENRRGETQLIFDLSQPIKSRVFSLPASSGKPHRLVIDLHNAKMRAKLPLVTAKQNGIRRIRTAKHTPTTQRVVLDLKRALSYRSANLKPKGRYGYRLLLTLENQGKRRVRTEKNSYRPQPLPFSQVPRIPNKKQRIIAIDPGHGGVDPGAIGRKGSYEKKVVLQIAKRLARLIEKTPDMKAVMIRDADYFLRLRERIDRARNYKADLFISIHADAQQVGHRAAGASVYILSLGAASNEAARWLAAKENSADLLGGIRLDDKDDVLASVLLDLSQTGTLEASGQLARHLLNSLGQVTPLHQSKVLQAGFMVLRSPDIPSVLVETSFISNPKEERKLNDPVHQNQIAQAILNGIQNYYRQYPAR